MLRTCVIQLFSCSPAGWPDHWSAVCHWDSYQVCALQQEQKCRDFSFRQVGTSRAPWAFKLHSQQQFAAVFVHNSGGRAVTLQLSTLLNVHCLWSCKRAKVSMSVLTITASVVALEMMYIRIINRVCCAFAVHLSSSSLLTQDHTQSSEWEARNFGVHSRWHAFSEEEQAGRAGSGGCHVCPHSLYQQWV